MEKAKVAVAGLMAAAVGVVGAVALTAGTAIQGANGVEPAIPAVARISNWTEIVQPLDRYRQNNSDRSVVLKAEYAAVKTCMSRYGIEFHAPAWDKQIAAQSSNYRLFGLLDETHARNLGYHSEQAFPVAESTYAGSLPAGYDAAFAGSDVPQLINGVKTTSTGCAGEARALVGDSDAVTEFVDNASFQAWNDAVNDSRVTSVFASWSACMRSAGYSYGKPSEANNDPRWQTETPSALEKQVALADVNCKKSTNVVGVRSAVQAAYENLFIAANLTRLNSIASSLANQVSTARNLSAQGVGDVR